MSRHYFDTVHKGFPITVVLGWDRPLDYFFLVIHKPTELVDGAMKVVDDDHLYSNLHERNPFNLDLDYYRQVLRLFGITVPESMFIEVQHDADRNAGNRNITHLADGSFFARNA
ncbi:hypothetical protein ACIU0H_28540 [Pseudomonas aeruginosa]